MDNPKQEVPRSAFWLNHVKAAEKFKGSYRKYCELHGLNAGSFSSYRNKFGFTKPAKEKKSKFSPIEVVPPKVNSPPPSLPDPQWLAEFLKAWSQR